MQLLRWPILQHMGLLQIIYKHIQFVLMLVFINVSMSYAADISDYPSNWPKIISNKSCTNVTGGYRANGLSQGRSKAIVHEINIEQVLGLGSFGGKVKVVSFYYSNLTNELTVRYFGQHLQSKDEYGKVPPIYRKSLDHIVKGACVNGQIIINIKTPWGGSGESNTVKTEVTSHILLAEDGSLIVKSISQLWISRWLGLQIDKSENAGWYKFPRN